MKLNLGDRVGYQGIDHQVEAILTYTLADRVLCLARLVGLGQVRFLEQSVTGADDRVLVLTEIQGLDITTPPPATIYHHGESYLLKISGVAQVTAAGSGPAGLCTLWRYRAAGGQFLQIEQWPDKVRMLAGASVHLDMLEIRPATFKNDTA
jgi:hypothetical protein